jgi:hypothetical protein
MLERLRAILAEVDALAPRTLVVFAHRQHPNAVLARELTAALLARADKSLGAAIMATTGELVLGGSAVSPRERKGSVVRVGGASRYAEAVNVFCQLCVDHDLLVCVNAGERLWVPDCFYLLHISDKEPLYDRKQVVVCFFVVEICLRLRTGCGSEKNG